MMRQTRQLEDAPYRCKEDLFFKSQSPFTSIHNAKSYFCRNARLNLPIGTLAVHMLFKGFASRNWE